jgi:hypothetical protein
MPNQADQIAALRSGGRRPGRNNILVPAAQKILDDYKLEIANELGIDYGGDLGELTSRQNGYVGGYMVRKMIQQVQNQMAQGQIQGNQLVQQPEPKQADVPNQGTMGVGPNPAQNQLNQSQF